MNVVRYEDGQLVQLQDDEGRVPPVVGHLNYPGVLQPAPVGRQMVPSVFGPVAAVEARFDSGAGRTRVGYARLPLEAAEAAELAEQTAPRRRRIQAVSTQAGER